jgi:hypothetical protein
MRKVTVVRDKNGWQMILLEKKEDGVIVDWKFIGGEDQPTRFIPDGEYEVIGEQCIEESKPKTVLLAQRVDPVALEMLDQIVQYFSNELQKAQKGKVLEIAIREMYMKYVLKDGNEKKPIFL